MAGSAGLLAPVSVFKDNNLQPLQALEFVIGVDVYRRDFKITPEVQHSIDKAKKSQDDEIHLDVNVALHSTQNQSIEKTLKDLNENTGVPRESIEVDHDAGLLMIRNADPVSIEKLVNIDVIKSIESVRDKQVTNDRAREILGATSINVVSQFQGEGQVMAIADTGLDKGTLEDMHPAFKDRVIELVPVGRTNPPRTDDLFGHGTHVCGSAIGAAVSQLDEYKDVQGTAPRAKLVMQSIATYNGLIRLEGDKLKELFLYPYQKHGACIHSNSWGDPKGMPPEAYKETEAKVVDELIWQNPELLIVMAAGNSGDTSETPMITGISACKNVLTVGATDSSRPSCHGFPDNNKGSQNDPTEVSWFSSRGPTFESRIKPDVLAPGTAILSTKTRAVERLDPKAYAMSKDNLYCYTYGTSMAAPLVAGCAVVLREYLVKSGMPHPPAALLKALLINGAYAFHHAHNGKEGFGIVNIANSLVPDKNNDLCGFRVGPPLDNKGKENTIAIDIPAKDSVIDNLAANTSDNVLPIPGVPISIDPGSDSILRVSPPAGKGLTLKVTLAYTDFPGARLQNNLNLSVTTSDGITRNGNRGTSKGLYDRYNNVKQVIWKGIPSGQVEITVSCIQWTTGEQDYALVWRVIPNED
ncbi:peptidase S8/S53 domain-containing protein [Xylariaceae sp. FL0662B]|nr:peptidase S8/S53 domain-containing protein [Xylariaceae sp. FL0662B]